MPIFDFRFSNGNFPEFPSSKIRNRKSKIENRKSKMRDRPTSVRDSWSTGCRFLPGSRFSPKIPSEESSGDKCRDSGSRHVKDLHVPPLRPLMRKCVGRSERWHDCCRYPGWTTHPRFPASFAPPGTRLQTSLMTEGRGAGERGEPRTVVFVPRMAFFRITVVARVDKMPDICTGRSRADRTCEAATRCFRKNPVFPDSHPLPFHRVQGSSRGKLTRHHLYS